MKDTANEDVDVEIDESIADIKAQGNDDILEEDAEADDEHSGYRCDIPCSTLGSTQTPLSVCGPRAIQGTPRSAVRTS